MEAYRSGRLIQERQHRIFVRHTITGKYLTTHLTWTKEIEDAWFFETADEALDLLRDEGIEDADVTLSLQRLREKTFSTRSASARKVLQSLDAERQMKRSAGSDSKS